MRVPPDILADPAAEVVVTMALGERVLASRSSLATALATAPGPEVLLVLGNEARQRKDDPAALALFARAYALDPESAEVAAAYARQLLAGDNADAAEAVTRPFADSDSPTILNARSKALLRLGRLDEAEALLWKALVAIPYWPSVQESRARLKAARQAAAAPTVPAAVQPGG